MVAGNRRCAVQYVGDHTGVALIHIELQRPQIGVTLNGSGRRNVGIGNETLTGELIGQIQLNGNALGEQPLVEALLFLAVTNGQIAVDAANGCGDVGSRGNVRVPSNDANRLDANFFS